MGISPHGAVCVEVSHYNNRCRQLVSKAKYVQLELGGRYMEHTVIGFCAVIRTATTCKAVLSVVLLWVFCY